MHKHTAVQTEQGEFILTKNGTQSFCPKLPPFQVGHKQGLDGQTQYIIGRAPCNTMCPFATIEEREVFKPDPESSGSKPDGKKNFYIIQCEGGKLEIQLDDLVLHEKKKESPLIKV